MIKNHIEEILAGLQYRFSPGFAGRVMDAIRNLDLVVNPALLLSEKISRLFYWINVPGLAALFVLVLIFIFHLLAGSGTDESGEAMALNEYIVNYYLTVQ